MLRYYTLLVMGITVVLPMSLLRDIRKLSVAAALSMVVYFALVCYVSQLDSKEGACVRRVDVEKLWKSVFVHGLVPKRLLAVCSVL